jgi:CRISPR-associated protein Cmr1
MQTNGGEQMRPLPKDNDGKLLPVPEIKTKARPEYITQVREYELITPLFGGGVEPGVADPVTTIRATEVRGHLRFWWRVTRGSNPAFGGRIELMKQAEDQLWGAASSGDKCFPSSVDVQVNTTNRGRKFIARNHKGEEVDVFPLNSPFGYAAFPLRDKRQQVIEGIKFSLTLRYPVKDKGEIEAALWAWEMFGGVGGRTRRGFGALKLNAIDRTSQPLPAAAQVLTAILQGIKKHLGTGKLPPDMPCVSSDNSDFVITAPRRDAIEAWKHLITRLKDFRQMRNQGTERGRPGRSQWPEPDAIRRLARRTSPRHRTPLSTLDVFPRAEFGLPIVFKFKDDGQGDPRVTTLEGANDENRRLASPLILRPLACANNQAVGLAMILDTPRTPPGGLRLADAPNNPIVTSDLTQLSDDELDSITPLDRSNDVLAAFLNFLEEN